jgi:hypothetical protein
MSREASAISSAAPATIQRSGRTDVAGRCLGDQAGEAGDEHVAADAGRAPLQAARQEDDEEGADPTPPG